MSKKNNKKIIARKHAHDLKRRFTITIVALHVGFMPAAAPAAISHHAAAAGASYCPAWHHWMMQATEEHLN
jgi:hypothetical protein